VGAVAATATLSAGVAQANPGHKNSARQSVSVSRFHNKPEVRVFAKATRPRTVKVRIVGVQPDRRYSPGAPYRVVKLGGKLGRGWRQVEARGRITQRGQVATVWVRFPNARRQRPANHFVNVYVRGHLEGQQRVFFK